MKFIHTSFCQIFNEHARASLIKSTQKFQFIMKSVSHRNVLNQVVKESFEDSTCDRPGEVDNEILMAVQFLTFKSDVHKQICMALLKLLPMK